MPDIIDYEHGISAIDSGYMRPMMDAIHLVVEGDRAAIIDTGTNASVPRVLAALAAKGLTPDQVDFVMLTHIHLDHAGGAGSFMRAFPNARLTVHPRGARHMIDPSRLIEGTIAVYGAEETRRLYGDILAVPKKRVIETPEGATVSLNGRVFAFHDTPGHARHQVAIHDTQSGQVFAGDTFGISFRELDHEGRQFIFPTTSPVQFEPDALHRSIDLIAGLQPAGVFVTHYGRVTGVTGLAAALHRQIDELVRLALSLKDAGTDRHARMVAAVNALMLAEAERHGLPEPRRVMDYYANDGELNAQGLEVWLDSAH